MNRKVPVPDEEMHTYLVMQNPGHSRVYFEQSARMALAELTIACKRFHDECEDMELVNIAGITYLSFRTKGAITAEDEFILSRLSFIFALFELVESGGRSMLAPMALPGNVHTDPKISQLLKYSGKTNEIFTRMMVNMGLLSSGFGYDQDIHLLDPVAGRGTTLFVGTSYGFDVAGIEMDRRQVHEGCVFFRKFLEKEGYKHNLKKTRGPKRDRSDSSDIQEFEYASTRELYKDRDTRRKLKFVRGDTANANLYFRKNSFHIIVGDLPYGIAHGSVPGNKESSPSRNPGELLSACLPEWYKVLRKGGVMVLSWNRFVLSREDMVRIIEENCFSVLADPPYDEFEHRVDMSIKRDVIVAIK